VVSFLFIAAAIHKSGMNHLTLMKFRLKKPEKYYAHTVLCHAADELSAVGK